jgi:hypothetical protein
MNKWFFHPMAQAVGFTILGIQDIALVQSMATIHFPVAKKLVPEFNKYLSGRKSNQGPKPSVI